MRALVFDLAIWKYLLGRLGGKTGRRLHYGPGTCFSMQEVPPPALPGDDWVLLKPKLTGFCGSDLSAIFLKTSPAMSALSLTAGQKAVFGHEVLAEVVQVGAGVRGQVKEGDRVVVDPVLGCEVRGQPKCPRCAEGEYATCMSFGTASPRGIMLGACTHLPGGFSDAMVAHKSQVFRVPDALSDSLAVLTEPLTVAVHAVLRHPPRDGENVLIVGGGMIAFSILWAIKEIVPTARVTLFTVEDYQLPIARSLGAAEAWSGSLLDQAAKATGSTVLKPMIGRTFLSGGFSRVYDCVGTHKSLDDSMRVTGGGGTIVLVGNAAVLPPLDMTFVWAKELKIEGTVFYGNENWRGKRARTFEVCLDLLTTTQAPVGALLTHTFPLGHYRQAIDVNLDRRQSKSVKAVFDLRAS